MTLKTMLGLSSTFGHRNSGSKEDSFADMRQDFKEEVDRMMEGFGAKGSFPSAFPGNSQNLTVRESDSGVEIGAQFPGVSEKDIEVILSGAILTIRSQRAVEQEKDASGGHLTQRMLSTMAERVNLSFEPDPAMITCTLSNGLLSISVPKAGSYPVKTARIAVRAK
jgi:HSP20 family protein